jgi:hypothetical protein
MKSVVSALTTALMLSACATSRVSPVRPVPADPQSVAVQPADAQPPLKKICVVENPAVVGDFIETYRTALRNKGYEVKVVKKNPQPSECPLSTRYTANWRWDLVPYLVYARLDVYRDGKPAGSAVHNARSSRFINVEATVQSLVDRLLP